MDQPVASLSLVAAKSRPTTTADTRKLELPGAVGGLFTDGAVQRGTTIVVEPGAGSTSLTLALAAAATGDGRWVAMCGLPQVGLVAAAELGARLERLALVPAPGERWPAVVAALIEGADLLVVGLAGRAKVADSRRLVARAREQGSVLVVHAGGGQWLEPPDLRLSVAAATWEGLGSGHGRLRARRVEVVVSGRRAAGRERRVALWLPGPGGAPTPASALDEAPAEEVGVMVG